MAALLLCLWKVFASGLAGTCSVPPTSRNSTGSKFCKGLFRRFLLPLFEATSTAAPPTKPSFPRCTYAILPSFHVTRFDFPFSITLTISHVATYCMTLAPSLVDSWCSLRSIVYLRFQRFQNWPSNVEKRRCFLWSGTKSRWTLLELPQVYNTMSTLLTTFSVEPLLADNGPAKSVPVLV